MRACSAAVRFAASRPFGAHVGGLEHYTKHGYKCKWGTKPADADGLLDAMAAVASTK